MRIAQIAPLYERIPPVRYGGTERIVSYLTEELVRRGHNVALYASGDSITRAELRAISPRALRLVDGYDVFSTAYEVLQMDRVAKEEDEFDIIHFHLGYMHLPLLRRFRTGTVQTMHGRLDLPEFSLAYEGFRDQPLISISKHQRSHLPHMNWVGNVYHGLPKGELNFHANPDGYLAFLGRICPEKRPDRAVRIAEAAGIPLKVAAKVDVHDLEYYETVIKPLFKSPLVEFVGEITESEKNDFLGNAMALLFPIDWPEPFGLTMIEALACGTPVIAYVHGSVPEVLTHGTTGFFVQSEEEAVHAVQRISELSRFRCRAEFDNRFTVEAMTDRYLKIFHNLSRRPADAPPITLTAEGAHERTR